MISADDKFNVFPDSKDFAKPTFINQTNNIIAGPNTKPWEPGMMYWTHSSADQTPMEREEGPLPVQGNIGMLVRDEVRNYSKCGLGRANVIGGSNNCTTAFYPDQFTTKDTCGEKCVLSSPESFGDKDFGFEEGSNKYTNAHGLHGYKNLRAGSDGQSSASGCYDFIPGVKTDGSTCMLNPNPVYQQVGDWMKLKENKSIISSSFNPNFN